MVMTHSPVVRHYERPDLIGAIRAALTRAGKDLDHLTEQDLAAIGEFHTRGRQATVELAARLAPTHTTRVLDLGSGIGGPSRYLAKTFGCHVTGIDLTPTYVEAARELARWVGLERLLDYRLGDATAVPFADGSFDLAWTQHVAMNIANKRKLYAEAHRVLAQGGRLVIHDVVQGAGGSVIYPTPWAAAPTTSHLVTPDALQEFVEAAGFQIQLRREPVPETIAWMAVVADSLLGPEPPPAALVLALGEDFRPAVSNLRKNLDEGRIGVVELVAGRE